MKRCLLAALLLLPALAALWSFRWLSESAEDARRAASASMSTSALLSRIREISESPRRAELSEVEVSDLTQAIERAAASAGIGPRAVLRIEPEAPRRTSDAALLEKPTRIDLDRVELGAFLGLLHRLCVEGSGLRVSELSLRAPYSEKVGSRWSAEITLSYLVYDGGGEHEE